MSGSDDPIGSSNVPIGWRTAKLLSLSETWLAWRVAT